MRFSCERCGKKYATAEDPAPGRVYKLKCKACGHLMVVKASAAPAAVEPPSGRVEVATPEPSRGAASGNGDGPPTFEATTEVSTAAMRGQAEQEPTPPPGDAGYVDLFSDIASGSSELPQKASDDPFLAAARASLPETYGSGASGAPDPFAGFRDDLAAPSGPAPPPRPPPKVPVIPKPNPGKTPIPLALIGAGVAVLVGIFAFAMLSPGMRAAPSASAPAAVATPSAPATPAPAPPETARAQPAIPVPPPHAAPEKADPRAEQRRKEREEAQARADQVRAEREARDREARGARDRARAERDAAAKAERDAKEQAAVEKPPAEPEGGLTQAQIEGVLRSTKPAFDGCIQAARAGDVTLDGRRVVLRLNIQTSGTVTSPTLDDAALNGTELGSCLQSAARLMVFPSFKGDTMRVEVPLVMR